MARPRKEGLDYFPHDTDATDDEKIDAMRALYGNDGYAFYFVLCERIYRAPNAELDISKSILLTPLIKKLLVSQEKFEDMLEAAFELELFDPAAYDERKVLTSSGIKKRFKDVTQMRQKWRKKKENPTENEVFPLENHIENYEDTTIENAEETGESKAKQSKVNKIINNTPTTTPNPFQLYESERFGMLSSMIGEKIGAMIDDFGELWVCKAMEEAVFYDKKYLPYVKEVLDRWKLTGHPEPWTLPKPERKSFNNVRQINKPQVSSGKPKLEVCKPTKPLEPMTPERWDELLKLAEEIEEKSHMREIDTG